MDWIRERDLREGKKISHWKERGRMEGRWREVRWDKEGRWREEGEMEIRGRRRREER